MYFKVHNMATVTVCYLLHCATPPSAGDEGDQDNDMNNNEACAGQMIHRCGVFVAEPSNNAKMNKDLSIDPQDERNK
jgi:hypothetical protein